MDFSPNLPTDDTFIGTLDSDTYHLAPGTGHDRVIEDATIPGGTDVLQVDGGLTLSDLAIIGINENLPDAQPHFSLLIVDRATGDSIVLQDQLNAGSASKVELLRFGAAGTTIDLTAGIHMYGTSAGETIWGSLFGDYIEGKGGNDTVFGRAGNDTLVAGAGNDMLDGGDDIDSLYGFGGTDMLSGGNGNDNLYGGVGADALDGGADFDYARYDSAAAGVTVDLGGAVANSGEAAGDTFVSVEGAVGSAFGDTIYGDAGANTLQGRDGDDTLSGRDGIDDLQGGNGNDTLDGGTGGDRLDGGAGTDFARYSGAIAGVTAYLASPAANTGEAAGDIYVSIEGLIGSNFRDMLSGDGGANEIQGLDGDDSLSGAAGADILRGGLGADYLYGGTGADVLDGGADFDYARYDSAAAGLTVDLGGVVANTGEATGDTFFLVEGVVGSAFGDTVYGDNSANTLQGRDSDDTLSGRGGIDDLQGGNGNDTLEGGVGGDRLHGGASLDFASYSGALAGVLASLATPASNTGDAAGDTYLSIEGLIGSNFNDDLRGDGNANEIRGLNGADAIRGMDGNDTLRGGSGIDNLYGGIGADVLDGGADFDYARYDTAAAAVTVDLSGVVAGTGEAAGDTFILIDGIVGSAFGDTVYGNNSANTLQGRDGNDTINGGAGDDDLQGGNDDDTLDGGTGGDRLDGGTGFDYVTYSGASGPVFARMTGSQNAGEAVGDRYFSIEGLIGTSFNDSLAGDGANNDLQGRDGNDSLEGGAGVDRLDGGAGFDIASYSQTASAGVLASLTSPATNTGDAAGDVYVSIEGLSGTKYNDTLVGDNNGNTIQGNDGNDSIKGSGGNDTLVGGLGDDQLYGGTGADVLSGGDGWSLDYARYDTAAAGVTVDLVGVVAGTGDAAGDTFFGIRGVIGSAFADMLYGWGSDSGSSAPNILQGRDGNDMLNGRGGDDTLQGGNGDDMLEGATGADMLEGGAGTDQLDGGDGFDFAHYGGAPAGVLASLMLPASNTGDAAGDTYLSIEGLIGSNFDDTLVGDGNANEIQGGNGNDVLDGRDGNDTLNGGAGDDNLHGGDGADDLYGGTGADVLEGGAGFDYARYDTASAGVTVDMLGINAGSGEGAGDSFVLVEGVVGSIRTDRVYGDGADNTLKGGKGNDVLYGRDGNDTLQGGEDNDTLDGGAGVDQLDGGGVGLDYFMFRVGEANGDTVLDFNGNGVSPGDELIFQGYGAGATFVHVNANMWQINYSGGTENIFVNTGTGIDPNDYYFM